MLDKYIYGAQGGRKIPALRELGNFHFVEGKIVYVLCLLNFRTKSME